MFSLALNNYCRLFIWNDTKLKKTPSLSAGQWNGLMIVPPIDFWKIELRKIELNELHFWSNSNLTFTICTLTQTQTNDLKIKETVKKRSLFLFHDATFQQGHCWNLFQLFHKWTSKGYGNMGCQFSDFVS